MERRSLSYALIVSVLLNLGVIGAAGYRALSDPQHGGADLVARLGLDAGQRQRWEALEQTFVREMDSGWQQIARRRESLVREAFSETPDPARIEAERAAIAQIQSEQQRRVIEQFRGERDILDAAQRRALVSILLADQPPTPRERQLHSSP